MKIAQSEPLEPMFIHFCPSPNSASFPLKCRYSKGFLPRYLSCIPLFSPYLSYFAYFESQAQSPQLWNSQEFRTFGVKRMFDCVCISCKKIKCYPGCLHVIRPPCPVTMTQSLVEEVRINMAWAYYVINGTPNWLHLEPWKWENGEISYIALG